MDDEDLDAATALAHGIYDHHLCSPSMLTIYAHHLARHPCTPTMQGPWKEEAREQGGERKEQNKGGRTKGGRTTLSETDTSTPPVASSHSTLSICTRCKGTTACLAIVFTSALSPQPTTR